jgi:3-methyladenine DNA glycosylase AlkD
MAATDTPLARTVMDRLLATYTAAADPAVAGPMRAYMRNAFPFLGLRSQQRRDLSRRVLTGLPRPTEADLRAIALACWELPEREYQYFAVDWLVAHPSACGPGFLSTAEILITTKSWWDTVDALASNVVGTIVARHPAAVATMDRWLTDENLWLIRTALLHQLRYKRDTDQERLFRYCAARADHPDFFIRKAIGWALREYAKTEPQAVHGFVASTPTLAPLSVREAVKNLVD